MGDLLGVFIGLVIAVFGVMIMRDPIRLAWLDPRATAYYQRTALRGPLGRHQSRMLGMILSFFGWVIVTGVLSGISKIKILDSISNGFLVLLWLSFTACFVFGVIYSIYQIIRGQGKELLLGSFKMRKRFIELGPVDFDPATTRQMQKEANIFTVIYFTLIGISSMLSLLVR
jgi:hypothetical protein